MVGKKIVPLEVIFEMHRAHLRGLSEISTSLPSRPFIRWRKIVLRVSDVVEDSC